ncbi:juvenile hormone acid O-methyltransferase-like [Onthophagus taurus]|uniref:juvenile hormone acid O-methyltransferase-like n=1 Tax=Onthophagus taurus TaxID=166361 RepID=UPI000C20433A|nr:juvenile hormone acid O-methyltransferase-like [Onthophagus taurus]
MYNSVLFSDSICHSSNHAKKFLTCYKHLFNWSNSENVLEIGCSDGRITINVLYPFVEKHLNKLVGGDICEKAIALATKANCIPKVSFQKLDILNNDECKNHSDGYNKIYSFYCFHLIHESDIWANNVFKMLKPNGQLFVSIVASFPNFINKCQLAQQREFWKPWSKYIQNLPCYFVDYGPKPTETVTNILRKAGFLINKIDLHTVTFPYKNKEDIRNVFISANPFLKYIPDEMQETYLDDYTSKLLQELSFENGIYSFRFDIITVLATKNGLSV